MRRKYHAVCYTLLLEHKAPQHIFSFKCLDQTTFLFNFLTWLQNVYICHHRTLTHGNISLETLSQVDFAHTHTHTHLEADGSKVAPAKKLFFLLFHNRFSVFSLLLYYPRNAQCALEQHSSSHTFDASHSLKKFVFVSNCCSSFVFMFDGSNFIINHLKSFE